LTGRTEYARQIDYPIQYQWTLLKGINDSQAKWTVSCAAQNEYAIMNLIPYNSLQDDEFQRLTTILCSRALFAQPAC
jgi:23S rRNA (adenine2503-C2)-methyltransferase